MPAADVDWQLFLRLVRFHRIEGLACNAMRHASGDMPSDLGESLSQAASAIAAHNLISATESRALMESFDHAGVPLLFLKGVTVSALAYGNAAIKSGIDIDVLIDPQDLGRAAPLLQERGFRLTAPREDAVLQSWHRLWKESVWTKPAPALQIDLHTRTADNRRLIPSINVHSPHQFVDVGNGIHLPTLAHEELFAYLAVHGASSAWFRLKWISDLAGMLGCCASEELEHLHRRSQELRCGRSASLALMLADHFFGTLKSTPDLRNELEQDKALRRIFGIVVHLLTCAPVEPTERRWGTLPIHRAQFALLPGLGFKTSELIRQVRQMLSRAS